MTFLHFRLPVALVLVAGLSAAALPGSARAAQSCNSCNQGGGPCPA